MFSSPFPDTITLCSLSTVYLTVLTFDIIWTRRSVFSGSMSHPRTSVSFGNPLWRSITVADSRHERKPGENMTCPKSASQELDVNPNKAYKVGRPEHTSDPISHIEESVHINQWHTHTHSEPLAIFQEVASIFSMIKHTFCPRNNKCYFFIINMGK